MRRTVAEAATRRGSWVRSALRRRRKSARTTAAEDHAGSIAEQLLLKAGIA
ncbi:MAG: hypothetical protein KF692_08640 [Cryobacterium sp.]|nr:hypothetical protein [Cryobacterium sp.]